MNLSEERRLEKLYAALDAMSLSPQNRALAEEYLDPSQPEQASLLKQAEHQDFSAIDKDRRSACISWLEHLKKRGREDEYGRFLRFAAATGGSTACYVLSSYTWNLRNTIASSLSPEQAAAPRVWGPGVEGSEASFPLSPASFGVWPGVFMSRAISSVSDRKHSIGYRQSRPSPRYTFPRNRRQSGGCLASFFPIRSRREIRRPSFSV